jgi:hypothetical protein
MVLCGIFMLIITKTIKVGFERNDLFYHLCSAKLVTHHVWNDEPIMPGTHGWVLVFYFMV